MEKISVLSHDFFVLAFFLLFASFAEGQAIIHVDSILVNGMIEECPSNVIVETLGEGPYFDCYITLENPSQEDVYINDGWVYFKYSYLGDTLSTHGWFIGSDFYTCIVPAKGKTHLRIPQRTMLNIHLHKSDQYRDRTIYRINHTKIFQQIAPTLQIAVDGAEIVIPDSTNYDIRKGKYYVLWDY